MTKQQRQYAIVGSVAVALILISAYLWLQRPADTNTNEVAETDEGANINAPQNTNRVGGSQNPQVEGIIGVPKGVPSGESYQSLVARYEGRRLQLDNCQSTPANVTFKNGTEIMLDGFSPDPQIITIGSQKFTLDGYDVAFTTLQSTTLPITLSVDCQILGQDQFNIAEILLQS